MKTILVSLFLLISTIGWSQTISGTVVDSEGELIPFASVALYQAKDSTIIDGCISNDNGEFTLTTTNQTEGSLFLSVSCVGYKTKDLAVEPSPMRIVLESIMLDDVVVVASRKIFKQNNGEIIASVKGSILEKYPKTADVIAQLPFISRQDGTFTVFGKGSPAIYINNRLVQDPSELERLLPSEIKSIKVNTMPGAKYDATVGAVIQIITEKEQGQGLSGTLYGSAKRSNYWSWEEFVDLNYRHKSLDFFASAYLPQRQRLIQMSAHQQLNTAIESHQVEYQEEEKVKSHSNSLTGGVSYNPNEKISAGIQYVGRFSSWKNDMLNDITHSVGGITETMRQFSLSDRPDQSHNVDAYFSGQLAENLSLAVNVDLLKGKENDRMNSWFTDNASEDVNTESMRQYGYYATKAVLTYNHKYVNIEGGAEYSYTDMTQTYDIDNTALGIDNSNDVNKQNRWALFATAKSQLGNWGIGAGLRYENIDFDYYENKVLNEEQSKQYHELFPSVFVNYGKKDFRLALSYERKIKYPSYSELRSNIQYSSPFVYEAGNPLLLPQIQNGITCMLGYKDLKAMLGYTLYEDYIAQIVELYNGNPVALMRTDNISGVKNCLVALSYAPSVGIWRPNFELGGQMQDFTLSGKSYNKPIFRVRWNNSFSFPKEWYLSVNAGWQSGGNSGIYLLSPSLLTNINLTKTFFDNKLSVSLMVNDLFKTERTRWSIEESQISFDYNKYSDSRYVQLTIQYNFNATRSRYKGNSSSDEKDRL